MYSAMLALRTETRKQGSVNYFHNGNGPKTLGKANSERSVERMERAEPAKEWNENGWNKLSHSFCEPHTYSCLSSSQNPTLIGSTLSSPPLSPSITLFHSRLKTHLFLKSFPP